MVIFYWSDLRFTETAKLSAILLVWYYNRTQLNLLPINLQFLEARAKTVSTRMFLNCVFFWWWMHHFMTGDRVLYKKNVPVLRKTACISYQRVFHYHSLNKRTVLSMCSFDGLWYGSHRYTVHPKIIRHQNDQWANMILYYFGINPGFGKHKFLMIRTVSIRSVNYSQKERRKYW